MTITTYKWSIEEWHDLVDSGVLAGKKVEFLEGEITAMSHEGVPHRNTNHRAVKYLRKLLDGLAEVYESHPITLNNSPYSRASEPEPDIAIVQLPESIYDAHHPYPENIYWLIEVSKETLRKRNNAVLGVSPQGYAPRASLDATQRFALCSDCFKKDLEQKTIIYACNSIPEYWVIDQRSQQRTDPASPSGARERCPRQAPSV